MAAASINHYVVGNRITVTATTTVLPSTLTTPTTWRLVVRNSADATVLTFSWNGTAATLPTGVNAAMDNPSNGVITFTFDVDTSGERRVYFAGTGACKCAGKTRFVIEKEDV